MNVDNAGMSKEQGELTFTVPLPEGLSWLDLIGEAVTVNSEPIPGVIDGEMSGLVEGALLGEDGVTVTIRTNAEWT